VAQSALRDWGTPSERVSPPVAADVARRALCVALSWMRFHIEAKDDNPDWPPFLRPEFDRLTIEDWAGEQGLLKCATIAETYWWTSPHGSLDEDTMAAAASVCSALTPLRWALGHFETMPPFDDPYPAEPEDAQHIPLLAETGRFVVGARLRPDAEIERARDVSELWRIRAMLLEEEREPGDEPGRLDELRAKFAARRGALEAEVRLDQGDLVAFGKPYRELDDDEHEICSDVALGRLAALNWLCGHAAAWDEVSADPL